MDKGRRCKVEQDTGEKGIKSNQGATHKLFIKTTLVSGVKLMPSEAQTLPETLLGDLGTFKFCAQQSYSGILMVFLRGRC